MSAKKKELRIPEAVPSEPVPDVPVNPETVSSVDDDRTANNTVRHQYRVLTDDEKATVLKIKDDAAAQLAHFESLPKSREMSLAITNMEQAVMWAVKAITK